MTMNTLRRRMLLGAAALPLTHPARAGQWPARPVLLDVGFPPGGAPDIVARGLAAAMSPALGQQMIVNNRPGAAGTISAAYVSRAEPDGQTLLMALAANLVTGPHLMASARYDPRTAFTPIGFIQRSPYYLIVAGDSPARDLKTLIARAAAAPGTVTLGIPGLGTPHHLEAELIMRRAGVSFNLVPFPGTPQGVGEVLGGRLDAYLDLASSAVQIHVTPGRLRYLAMTGERRASNHPDVPTFQESGIAGVEAYSWFGLVGPKGMPEPVTQRLSVLLGQALQTKSVRDQMLLEGIPEEGIASGSPQALTQWIDTEFTRWGELIKEANIKL